MEEKIKNLEELLQEFVGPDKVLVEKTYTDLMAPGENYLSDMQNIHLVLESKKTGLKEEIDVVAKCAIMQAFGPTFIFTENEITYYKKVIPALQKFRDKHGLPRLDFFPQFIAGRINLTGTDQPDIDAVLVLENLKIKGYGNLDRHVGFTLPQAKAVLKDLATLHSTALAFKLLEPETFRTEITEACILKPPPMDDKKEGPAPPPNFVPCFIHHFKSNKKFAHVVPHFEKFNSRLQKLMENPGDFFNTPIVEPFATLIHNDMWLNNTMQKIRGGEVVSNKLVDFQMCKIGSPGLDLLFFLISSVNSEVLRKHFEALLRYYHEIFSEVLNQFGCYGPRFTYEKLMKEIRVNASFAVGQCMFMLPTAVFNEKGKAFDMKPNGAETTIEDVPSLAVEKIEILALEGCKRDWIW